jgi:hypothetical protein
MSFKFGNDIFIIFEMPRSSFLMSIAKMKISLLFRPSASEVFGLVHVREENKWSDFKSSDKHVLSNLATFLN